MVWFPICSQRRLTLKIYCTSMKFRASNGVGSTIQMSFILTLGGLALVMLGGFFAVRGWIVAPVKGCKG